MKNRVKIFTAIAASLIICATLLVASPTKAFIVDITNPPQGNNGQPYHFNVTVTIENFSFSPKEVTINAGEKVIWKQKDSTSHTVVSGSTFKSQDLKLGDRYEYTFSQPGEYSYNCGIHPSMTGKVIVK